MGLMMAHVDCHAAEHIAGHGMEYVMHMLKHAAAHTLEESINLLPILFITYLVMEYMEHRAGKACESQIRKAGKLGPVWGGLLGMIPQCGFSTAATSLYAGRVITVGTLLAVYLSTSDEMLPIMISESVPMSTIAKIVITKAMIAIISGLAIEMLLRRLSGKKEVSVDLHEAEEHDHCECEHSILKEALYHTAQVFGYILLVTFVMNVFVELIGEETLAGFFSGLPVLGQMIAALVGLIPNCASSVVITQLYLAGIIGAGAMMAGLLVNAGVGVMVLLKLSRNWRTNSKIVGALYGIGVFWGVVIQATGIVF